MKMTRRDSLKSIALAIAAVGVGLPPATRYGAVDVSRHRVLMHQGVHLHVIHHGRDVTNRCFFADDTGRGLAKLYVHDAQGKPYWDPRTQKVPTETVYGVTFQEGPAFA